MVNTIEFTNRLKQIMEYYQLTASLFADKISVQRSSISHILSGRNKPSLDFVLKITDTFKEVDMYWLLNGKGMFPKQDQPPLASTPPNKAMVSNMYDNRSQNSQKNIQRIVVFYEDGTFDEFNK